VILGSLSVCIGAGQIKKASATEGGEGNVVVSRLAVSLCIYVCVCMCVCMCIRFEEGESIFLIIYRTTTTCCIHANLRNFPSIIVPCPTICCIHSKLRDFLGMFQGRFEQRLKTKS